MTNRENDKHSLVGALTPLTTSGTDGQASAPPTPSSGERPSFVPGTVFAGRYRMITRVGRGGMGEVWRADDLVLETPVALKLVHSASQGARERLLQEVRMARSITHPAVCRVFDVGETGGQAFYSMEFVEGEDLATLLRRAGRLPQERVIEIGRQLCDGIAAAHAQGVLHRDLKPANVLIDEAGAIRITDFGIATWRADGTARTLIGTPGYMAPEQLTMGAPLSECTDVYAIGVILYELLLGHRPDAAQADGVRPVPSEEIPDVDPRLERAIVKALAPDPARRHASAAATAEALTAGGTGRTRPRLLAVAVLACLAIVGGLAGRTYWTGGSAALTDHDTIVLADFVNATDDPVFDRTLKVAAAVALEQSPYLKVFPDQAVRDTLRLMARQPGEPLTRALARDVARREGLKALVAGSISPLGSHYVLTLEAISTATGDITARQQVEVAGKEEVLSALGQAATRLRESLGESLPSIRAFDAPLARATTPSLEALHAYSLALDDGRIFMRLEAIPHLNRAIELDPDFALAHALLSGVYANTGQTAEALPHARRAFELRNRVSERERYFISWRYYVDALQAWDRALELASAWTTAYPREAFAFNSLGLALSNFGEHERAIEAFRRAVALDPKFVPPHRNMSESLIALNRFDEAGRLIDEAAARGVSSIGLRQMRFLVGLVAGDSAWMTAAAADTATSEARMWALNSEAHAAAFAGRVREAHDLYDRSIQLARNGRFRALAARWMIEDAETHALAGQCAEARSETDRALALARDNLVLERAARALAVCGAPEAAEALAADLGRDFADATLTTRLHLPIVHAALAVDRRDGDRALQLLDPLRPYDYALGAEFWPAHLRGRAHLLRQDAAAASAEFQAILEHRGAAPASPLYALAHVGLARAAALLGDAAAARREYLAFFDAWRDADADLPVLQDARAASEGLR
ncbi:MAG: serine/threonine-protein kinase [Vicinamibacterales bacterium]